MKNCQPGVENYTVEGKDDDQTWLHKEMEREVNKFDNRKGSMREYYFFFYVHYGVWTTMTNKILFVSWTTVTM